MVLLSFSCACDSKCMDGIKVTLLLRMKYYIGVKPGSGPTDPCTLPCRTLETAHQFELEKSGFPIRYCRLFGCPVIFEHALP